MSDNDQDTILVTAADTTITRKGGPQPLKVEVLAESVNVFMTQISHILDKAPDEVGKFQFTEFTVSAEISAKGQLILLGTGGEAQAKGGVTFTFKKTPALKGLE